MIDPSWLRFEHEDLFDMVEQRRRMLLEEPRRLIPWLFRPCTVKTLLVTDGGLDFGSGGFGLKTFVETLLGGAAFYARFEITLAHIRNRSGDAMMDGDPRIAKRITRFRFDDPGHFDPGAFDQVWLFGIESSYENSRVLGDDSVTLLDSEIDALKQFMEAGGGLFATGDHATLGRALCSAVPRVKSMRLWDSTSQNEDLDQVSMGGPRRNDTNARGHDLHSQFNDQSDDVPQVIQPKLYRRYGPFIWQSSVFPHPILCGPDGVIDVMPDHPHEGECIEPSNPSIDEFPASTNGSTRPLPEVISTSIVPAGNDADETKDPTLAHCFGGICAYDGHRASKGRVVTDATWHHFVNINLVGDPFASGAKTMGFLASAVGQAHLKQIRAYYTNIAVWISPPDRIQCMNNHILWRVIWADRVLEAVATKATVTFAEVDLRFLSELGRHARDVLGRYAGRCQTYEFILELITPVLGRALVQRLDPWVSAEQPRGGPLPWIDIDPLLTAGLGGAILAIREQFPEPDPELIDVDPDGMAEIAASGAQRATEIAMAELGEYVEVRHLVDDSETKAD